ncbi:hypothetical protein [Pseudomonas phage pPA-N1803-4At.2]|nr:hypothetical protein [Pseudomonas phage pPA-N1803-4At.2]
MADTRAELVAAWNVANKPKDNNGRPRDLTVDDVEFIGTDTFLATGTNAKTTMRAKTSSLYFKGEAVIYFNRRSLPEYCLGIKVPGKPTDYTDNLEVAEKLRDVYGIPFIIDEIQPQPITGNTVTIHPYFNNLSWIPTIPVTLEFESS